MADFATVPVSSEPRAPRGHSLRVHLAALALACTLPLLSLSIYTIFSFAQMERDVSRNDILAAARAASTLIDQHVRNFEGDLRGLAAFYVPGHLDDFYNHAAVTAAEEGAGVSIALIKRDAVVFDTRYPLGGGQSPAWEHPVDFAHSSGRLIVSDLFIDRIDGVPKIAIYVPLRHDNATAFLVASVPTGALSALLAIQGLPPDWTVGLSDRNRIIIARGAEPQGYVGRQVPSTLVRPTGTQREVFADSPGIGQGPQYLAMIRSTLTDWVLVIGIPQGIADAPLYRSFGNFLIVGMGFLLLGLAAAALIGGSLSRAMTALSKAALGLINHQPVPAIDSTIREVQAASDALSVAGERLRQNDEHLRRVQTHLARAQSVAGVGSFERDLRTGKGIWSDEIYAITGLPRDGEPSFERFIACIDEADRPQVLMSDHNARLGFDTPGVDLRFRRPDGGKRVLHIETKVIREAHRCQNATDAALDESGEKLGAIVGYFGTMHDITDRVDLEDERRDLQTRLHQSQKLEALGTLAGGIAHDLNNTLVPVVALTKLVRNGLPEDSMERQDLDTVIGAAGQARDLVKQILTFSRQESGEKGPLDLAIMLRESLKMLRATIPVTVELQAEVTGEARILAEPSQLHQIFVNLATNAAQAIGDRPGKISVRLTRQVDAADRATVHLAIADTGCGMDEATCRRVFEPFFTTKSVGEGTGLGLSVVHGIVAELGGSIAVTSNIGEGTTFEIVFPALADTSGDAQHAA
ncbi:MAG TPA: ATP-binding protein [Stellaceae bacterium]|nr:ATP-binding protein [Stellaceae bacterium]